MMTDPTASTDKTTVQVKFGRVSLQGWQAIASLVLLLIVVVLVIIVAHPSLRMLLSGAIWIVFTNYWSYQAAKAARTTQVESKSSRRFHQLLLNGALLLLFVPVPGLRGRYVPLNNTVVAIGFAVQIGFILFAISARRHLGRYWSGAISSAEGHQLIRTGPYRFVRHPIYTAMIGMSVGTTLISGEIHALLGALVFIIAYWRKIRLEEAHLRTLFGQDYESYSGETWALIPWVV